LHIINVSPQLNLYCRSQPCVQNASLHPSAPLKASSAATGCIRTHQSQPLALGGTSFGTCSPQPEPLLYPNLPTHAHPSTGHPSSDPSTNSPSSPSSAITALPAATSPTPPGQPVRRLDWRVDGAATRWPSQPNSLQTAAPLSGWTQKKRRSSRTSAGNGSKSLKLSLEASLKRLRTDYIDSMYLHCESTMSCHIGELLTARFSKQ